MKAAIDQGMSHSRPVTRVTPFSSVRYAAWLAFPLMIVGLAACNRGGTDPADQELGGGDGDAPVPVGWEESATARALTDGGTAGTTGTGTTSTGGTTASGGGGGMKASTGGGNASGGTTSR